MGESPLAVRTRAKQLAQHIKLADTCASQTLIRTSKRHIKALCLYPAENGKNALQLSITENQLLIMRELVLLCPKAALQLDSQRNNALMVACAQESNAAAEYLLGRPVTMCKRNQRKKTRLRHIECLPFDLDQKNATGHTALAIAARGNCVHLIELILKAQLPSVAKVEEILDETSPSSEGRRILMKYLKMKRENIPIQWESEVEGRRLIVGSRGGKVSGSRLSALFSLDFLSNGIFTIFCGFTQASLGVASLSISRRRSFHSFSVHSVAGKSNPDAEKGRSEEIMLR
mmetsp:Transcript_6683/g.25041  ORF Transcript_6683/g.25041 Transcript_6683/m.25041 type:complete len:288 (+) Transcript_6683:608-1471(+)